MQRSQVGTEDSQDNDIPIDLSRELVKISETPFLEAMGS